MSKLYYSPKNQPMKDYIKFSPKKTSSRNYSHSGLYGEVNPNILRQLKKLEKGNSTSER